MTRRELLAHLAGIAALPVAAVSCGRGPAGASVSQATRPLHYSSLADVAKLLAAREIQSLDLTHHLLDRIAAVDGRLQSYVTVMADRAITSARPADAEIRAGRERMRRAQADVWPSEPLRRVRPGPLHGSRWADDPHGGRRRHHVRSDGWFRSSRPYVAARPGPLSACRSGSRHRGPAGRVRPSLPPTTWTPMSPRRWMTCWRH